MKFREHRGTLAASMETVVELDPTKEALVAYLSQIMEHPADPEAVDVRPYAEDRRIGWDSYIVTYHGAGVGFTDGPLVGTQQDSVLPGMSELRKERREQERDNAKIFEATVKNIREYLEDRPSHDEMKQAIQAALERLEINEHPNNLIAVQLIEASVKAALRGDESDKLLFYLAGVVVEHSLQVILTRAIQSTIQHTPVTQLPPL